MSTVRILRRGVNLIHEVVALLRGNSMDLDTTLVVFPGKRPGHFVRKSLASARNSGFLAPKILAYDELVDFLSARLGLHQANLDPLDAAPILFEIHRSLKDSIGSGYFSSFDEFLPLGFRLFDELEELYLADADERRIDNVVGGITFGRRHVLATYFKEFYRNVEAKGFASRSTKLKAAADRFDSIDLSEFQSIVLAGFYALTPVDRRLFRRFLDLDRATFLFQEGPGLSSQLRHIGIDMADAAATDLPPSADQNTADPGDQMDLFAGGGLRLPADGGPEIRVSEGPAKPIRLSKSSDLHGQVFALAGLFQSIQENKEPLDERTVIVLLSSDALFPVLQQTLPLLPKDGYNISLGYPLSRTPLYAFLSSLLDLTATARDGSLEAAAYLRFVLHPYIKNIRYGTRSDITRVLFHSIEGLIASRPSTTVRLEDLESDQRVLERVEQAFSEDQVAISKSKLRDHLKNLHDLTIRPFLNIGSLRDFSAKTIALIQSVNDRSTAHLHPLFPRYAEWMIEIVDRIQGSLAAEQRFARAESYASFLRSYVGPQTVPFPGTPLGGVQVLGLLETRNLSFDRVIVLDASDENLPGGRGAELLLPQGAREELELETSGDRERLIEYYFDVLLRGAREVHLFYPENKDQEKSRFIEKLLWHQQRQAGLPDDDGSVQQIRYRIHLVNPPPAAVEKSAENIEFLREFELSATALDQYLKCPLRFYYRYVLRLKEKEEVGEEIEQYDIGNVVHGILKSYFEPMVGRALKEGDLDPRRMEAVTESAFEEALGKNLKGASLLLKRQTAERLKEFLHDYQEQVIKSAEVEILGVEQTVSVIKNGHHFSGRVDRIERRGEKIFILDYKIRQDDAPYRVSWKKFVPDNADTWSESIGSVQLPMYMLLYSESSGERTDSIVPAYVFLGRNRIARDIEVGLSKDGIVTEDMYRNLEKVILGLAEEIKDPKKAFVPTEDQKKQCPGCPYQVICGTQWAKEGRW